MISPAAPGSLGSLAEGRELREIVSTLQNTDKFVSYTNANKDGAGTDVNRARFHFYYSFEIL